MQARWAYHTSGMEGTKLRRLSLNVRGATAHTAAPAAATPASATFLQSFDDIGILPVGLPLA